MAMINIARTIINKRKEKGLTQDDLANFIGVTKASVSKWETGQSYPDIVLLPQLASYFNISVDDLMGYEPQMTDDDIGKLYQELAVEFATKPFDEVMERCRDITKKYFSCFPLLYSIGLLYVNYGYTLATIDEEQKSATLTEAKELFVRVKEQADDVNLKRAALYLEATCEFMQGNPTEVIDLLDNVKNYAHASNEILLSQAYLALGKTKEAKNKLQGNILEGIANIINSMPSYLSIVTDDTEHFEETCKRMLELINTFKINALLPFAVMPFYLGAAHGYLLIGDTEKSLDMLEQYTEIATNNPFESKDDNYFKYIEGWSEQAAELPCDKQSISQSMIDAVSGNPIFSDLAENPRFISIEKRLRSKLT